VRILAKQFKQRTCGRKRLFFIKSRRILDSLVGEYNSPSH
jgi:hypothetical protein